MSSARVYLVRHAEAEKAHPGGDAARRLTPDGRRRFELIARSLAPRVRATRVVASPAARAVETANVLAAATGAVVELEDDLASGRCGGRELLELARRVGAGAALVGHNPEVCEAVSLASGRDEAVPPGTIAELELSDDGGARLVWIEVPG